MARFFSHSNLHPGSCACIAVTCSRIFSTTCALFGFQYRLPCLDFRNLNHFICQRHTVRSTLGGSQKISFSDTKKLYLRERTNSWPETHYLSLLSFQLALRELVTEVFRASFHLRGYSGANQCHDQRFLHQLSSWKPFSPTPT